MSSSQSVTAHTTPQNRLQHLDALRGIAAVVVVAHHALLANMSSPVLIRSWSAVNIVVLGRPAVILFFVLSGFVLTLHLNAIKQDVVSYSVRRVLRLMPPYLVTILGAAALFALTQPHRPAGLSSWFDDQWGSDIGASEVMQNLALLAGPRQFPLDHVAWSLVHELRLSLVLPLFLCLARRIGPACAVAVAGAMTLLANGAVARWPDAFPTGVFGFRFDVEGIGLSLLLTARFAVAFALGAVLATHGDAVKKAVRRPGAGLAGMVIALALLSSRDEMLMAAGATLLIAIAAWTPWFSTGLSARPLLWLGNLSFSLYLVHLPIMLACVSAGPSFLPAWIRLAVGVALAVPVAAAMARLVEQPSIRWSRAVARLASSRERRRPLQAVQNMADEACVRTLIPL